MPERATDRRRREEGRPPAPPTLTSHIDPVLALQRAAGNRAVAGLLAREPAAKGATGSVQIRGIGAIKVRGGNLAAWSEKGAVFDTVELTSEKGKHSTKLEKLAKSDTRMDVTVTISPAHKEGEELNVGGGTALEIKDARVADYAVEDGAETWRLVGFQDVKRTKTTRQVSTG